MRSSSRAMNSAFHARGLEQWTRQSVQAASAGSDHSRRSRSTDRSPRDLLSTSLHPSPFTPHSSFEILLGYRCAAEPVAATSTSSAPVAGRPRRRHPSAVLRSVTALLTAAAT